MKKIITALFLMLSLASFSQQLTYKSGGAVYGSDNKKLSPDEVRKLMANNSEALSLYNEGRNKKTWGNVLFYGGIGLVATNLILGMTTHNSAVSGSGSYTTVKSERTDMTAAIIGGALIVASIPIKIGYSNKIKSALTKYNNGVAENYLRNAKTTLISSRNQIGFRIEF